MERVDSKESLPALIISEDIDIDENIVILDIYSSDSDTDDKIDNFVPMPPQQILLVTEDNDTKLYKIPPRIAKSARKIWKRAGLFMAATSREIELKLLDWAFNNARLEIKDKNITKIFWKINNGAICSGTWTSFIRWMLCATYSTIGQ